MTRVMPPIVVKAPCPKRWAEMRGDTKTRYCDHCQLYVHNLSAMNRSELSVVATLRQTERTCVTYVLRPDGTMITRRDSLVEALRQSCRRAFLSLIAAVSLVAFGAGILALLLLSLGPPLPYYRVVKPMIDCSQTVTAHSPLELWLLRLFGVLSALTAIAFALITLSV